MLPESTGEAERGLSSPYVSSYTPSLAALIMARRDYDKSQPSLFAAMGKKHLAGSIFTLESVEPELDIVNSLLPPSPIVYFTKVPSIESTRSRALHALQDNYWPHFACHGTQDMAGPFNSAFFMCDKPLTLLDIIQTDLSKHEYAFFPACDTAVGVSTVPTK